MNTDPGEPGSQVDSEAATVTALVVLRPHLSSRVYNLLTREGFTTVEEIAARDDFALLDIRTMGLPSIAAIREATATVRAEGIAATALHLDAGKTRELVWLLSTLSAYAEGQGSRDVARRADAFLLGLGDCGDQTSG